MTQALYAHMNNNNKKRISSLKEGRVKELKWR
jgi:hypothetical protein